MHLKLMAPKSGSFQKSMFEHGVLMNPQNDGFDQDAILQRLEELSAQGHTYEVIDSEALTAEQRRHLYFDEAFGAVARAGNRYRIRQVFGSRKHSGAEDIGTNVPVLIVLDDGEPVDVYPHQLQDGMFRTIRNYLDAL